MATATMVAYWRVHGGNIKSNIIRNTFWNQKSLRHSPWIPLIKKGGSPWEGEDWITIVMAFRSNKTCCAFPVSQHAIQNTPVFGAACSLTDFWWHDPAIPCSAYGHGVWIQSSTILILEKVQGELPSSAEQSSAGIMLRWQMCNNSCCVPPNIEEISWNAQEMEFIPPWLLNGINMCWLRISTCIFPITGMLLQIDTSVWPP